MPSSGPADDPILARSVGNYRVEKRIGAGAMGAVYRLKHQRLPHTYAALKVLKEGVAELAAMKARFAQEALAAAALGGQRVARPLDLGVFEDGLPYIVMEYVEGRTLAEELAVCGPLPVLKALRITHRIADAMRIAHAKGIVHRDLKPSNIMLTGGPADPGVKLLDFGVAQMVGEFKVARTIEHSIIGSPGFMSPEAATGLPVDGRTDVFSLGVTLYLMLAGRLPFPPPLDRQGVAALLAEQPPPIDAHRPGQLEPVPKRVQALITWALAKERRERCTMEELRAALLETLMELAPGEAPSLQIEAERPDAPPPDVGSSTLSISSEPVGAEDPGDRWQTAHDLAEAPAWLSGGSGRRGATLRWLRAAVWGAAAALALGLAALAYRSLAPRAAPSLPVVILMDSPLPERVYDPETRALGGTNSDDVTDALQNLPIVVMKEPTSALWHREEQVLREQPSLVMMHLSSFARPTPGHEGGFQADAQERTRSFLAFVGVGNPATRFVVYTRGFETDAQRNAWVSGTEERFPVLKGRLQMLHVPGADGKATFRDPLVKQRVREIVVAALALSPKS